MPSIICKYVDHAKLQSMPSLSSDEKIDHAEWFKFWARQLMLRSLGAEPEEKL